MKKKFLKTDNQSTKEELLIDVTEVSHKSKPMKRRLFKTVFLVLMLLVILVSGCNLLVLASAADQIYTGVDDVPNTQAIIILGASVHGDRLSMVLEDRTLAGIALYQMDDDAKLLLSGDHGEKYYDEVNAMRKYILANAPEVDDRAIFMDHAGFDTYDSLYRAKHIFGVDQAIIVTQSFHISRAVYIAKSLGIDAVGYAVDETKYKWILRAKWQLRECLSRVKAVMDVETGALPKYEGDPIPISGDGHVTWDQQ
ncbi:YdcF family protein [Fusibacter paucivorans]|uniref:YdcF family protein n=1 Tax=Fusibacter paucivorans TaxID=76009 RepID=A0ABS5PR57_9FIRM|nr:ElyC/SanA/YdcF family protein [Fusibacter paucivorans]MBS7527650.1 YdcF family protein [Fusibacter paucivorans]